MCEYANVLIYFAFRPFAFRLKIFFYFFFTK